MESCLLCLEVNKNVMDYIKVNSSKWRKLNITELIKKHFWPLSSMMFPSTSGLCLPCWQELYSFHNFYLRVEEAHIKSGKLLKFGDTTQSLERNKYGGNDDVEKEHFTYDLLEPEILIGEGTKNKEIKLKLPTVKTEPQDEIDDIPIEDASTLIQEQSVVVEEIKLENDDVSTQNDGDSDSNSDNNCQPDSDSSQNMEDEKQKTYKNHEQNHPFEDLPCDLCKTNFKSFQTLREHFTVIHKQKDCVICCNKKFFCRTRLIDHMLSHLNPDHFKCNECGRIMSDRRCLDEHVMRAHRASEIEKKHCCDVCFKLFLNDHTLRKHKLSHLSEDEKKFPCSECGKSYASSYLLKHHTRAVHLKKFTKICNICGKSLPTNADYKVHMNQHEGIPPPIIRCDVCGIHLTNERGLRRHKNSQHPIGGKKDHCCPVCPKISPTLRALRKHISTMHEKGYDHRCTMCEKIFKNAEVLKEHMASHAETNLYLPLVSENF